MAWWWLVDSATSSKKWLESAFVATSRSRQTQGRVERKPATNRGVFGAPRLLQLLGLRVGRDLLLPPPACPPAEYPSTPIFRLAATLSAASLPLPLQVLAGTPFYRIDGYESLYVFDSDNDPPYVQLELYKVREYQNWEDLLLETSSFTPGGAQ